MAFDALDHCPNRAFGTLVTDTIYPARVVTADAPAVGEGLRAAARIRKSKALETQRMNSRSTVIAGRR
jgi:hypothetical protein